MDHISPSSNQQQLSIYCVEQKTFESRQSRWRNVCSALELPLDLHWWTSAHVADCLEYIGFSQHADNFESNNINGEVLVLADVSLLKEIIPPVGDRILILRARDTLLVELSRSTSSFPERSFQRRSQSTQRYLMDEIQDQVTPLNDTSSSAAASSSAARGMYKTNASSSPLQQQ